MKAALKCIALLAVFAILFVASAVIIPLDVEASAQDAGSGLGLIVLLIIDVAALLYLVLRLDLNGARLFVAVVLVFWGLQTFMTQLETWYFWDAMPEISAKELVNLFIRPLIAVVCFVPIAMWAFGKSTAENNGGLFPFRLNQEHAIKIGVLSLAYAVIYFVFGYYVAWQFESVRVFYSGTAEQKDFFGQLADTFSRMPWIIPFQVLRGALWILAGLPIVLHLRGTRTEKILACTLLYATLPTVQLLVTNPFMPAEVRIAHFWEVGSSQAVFGLMIGLVMTMNANRKRPWSH